MRQQLTGIPNNENKQRYLPKYLCNVCVHVCSNVCVGTSDSAESLGWVWHTVLCKGCLHGDRCGVISMTMDRRGCWPPRSRTKDKARVIAATQTGNRRGALQGGVEEKGAISQAKLLLGWRREKYHSNNGTRDERREGEGEGGGGGGGAGGSRKEEGGPKQNLNYQSHQTCMLT